ncbi:hypothetical protein [Rubritalea tangerina]|uniref:hypothetical protein n=1 Tax=Rubritalea tangerina TaxID=430798 RepID=UPI0036231DFD
MSTVKHSGPPAPTKPRHHIGGTNFLINLLGTHPLCLCQKQLVKHYQSPRIPYPPHSHPG